MTEQKKNDQLPVIVGDIPQELVQYLGQGSDTLETMRHHRILNRLAVVQGLTKREIKEKFGQEGTVIIPATETKLIDKKGTFDIVPVMFFDEFITWRDRKDQSGSVIMEKSVDRAGKLAAKAMDPNRREERYGPMQANGEQFRMRHTHHLNFLVVIYSGDFKGTLAVMSFSRGEYRRGEKFIGQIQQRKFKTSDGRLMQAPLWSTRWKVTIGDRKNAKGEWCGFDMVPADQPNADPTDFSSLNAMHEELKKEYHDQLLSVGHEVAEGMDDDLANSTEM